MAPAKSPETATAVFHSGAVRLQDGEKLLQAASWVLKALEINGAVWLYCRCSGALWAFLTLFQLLAGVKTAPLAAEIPRKNYDKAQLTIAVWKGPYLYINKKWSPQ